ncbi:MAG: hypothetical protein JO316_25430 [Abitibacteriaceae bacterium]|nr:hypothetical protein [Abditibacteriaceae bacterium]MBV9868713.1 hypothetical protein [Abditibacteriaceae bacterium]
MGIGIGLIGTVLVALATHWFYPKYTGACFIAASIAAGVYVGCVMLLLILSNPEQAPHLIANAPFMIPAMLLAFLPTYAIAALVGLPFRQLREREARIEQHSVTVEVD